MFIIKERDKDFNLHKVLINNLIVNGKQKKALYIFLKTLFFVKCYLILHKKKMSFKDPMLLIFQAIENIRPSAELAGRVVAGRVYQIPLILDDSKSVQLGIKILLKIVRNRVKNSNEDISAELAKELIRSFKGKSEALSEKEKLEVDVLYNRPNLRFL